jgi:hypothetical protein
VRAVSVKVRALFGGRGEPARDVTYSAVVQADASPDAR